ncbi:Not1 N-terminal domain, CCR4-Not complex component-domain-containing protein [Radiomyces spectabilis]|uniref:Not1 N-terminal domain, CCR4-Not complex component-domain-containing protein n=1 Tax=Radiomyces spectabilis TaxID=64574 RepID=UPI00221F3DAD|nr:Not1 N-terminal domain, CCR4-Not complex component-domain-containing protein [Radiomyces spectabilis]KAI8388027.1 Not1 N-terminal domain, CCR4-Not complex component-domain-containing protein [Radiomyces spectabilis]
MSMKKLQTEIDRVLKKVSEGVDTFETIFDKIHSTNNANQKEKYEQDLKKEIKKLQRLRDQIKTWLSSNEIKDKRSLLENRKLIESQMERFKAIEKEMKTKAYSKEGLLQREKLDPKEKEKMDTCDWITSTVDELSRQIESAEYELETLQGTTRKGKKDHAKVERSNELDHAIERNKWHISRLELILRLLENDHLEPEKVMAIKDDVQYYVECNQEPDFEEDEFVYDDLNLEEEEELYAIRTDEFHREQEEKEAAKMEEEKISSKRAAKEKEKEKEKEEETQSSISDLSRSTSKLQISPKKETLAASPEESKAPAPKAAAVKHTESVPTPPSTGLKYAQAAAAGVSGSTSQDNLAKLKDDKDKAAEIPSAWTEPPKIVDQFKQPAQQIEKPKQQSQSPAPTSADSVSQNLLSAQYSGKTSPLDSAVSQSQSLENEARLPSSLADFASSFEAIKSKATKEDMMYTHQMLDVSLQHVPDLIDSERPKIYQPRTPYLTPSYYPQQPLAIFDNPALFEKFDMDALFFIFYYQQGTYQQYLAAKELKKQSWRFHKKYLTWFQRHEEPKIITEEYEQGTYIYFDYEGAWCQRKKTEFRFEYRYLEEA